MFIRYNKYIIYNLNIFVDIMYQQARKHEGEGGRLKEVDSSQQVESWTSEGIRQG